MVILTTYPSNNIYEYTTKSAALKEIRSNGLKGYQYTLIDNNSNTTYMNGLWLSNKELEVVRGFKTMTRGINYIQYQRKETKR